MVRFDSCLERRCKLEKNKRGRGDRVRRGVRGVKERELIGRGCRGNSFRGAWRKMEWLSNLREVGVVNAQRCVGLVSQAEFRDGDASFRHEEMTKCSL